MALTTRRAVASTAIALSLLGACSSVVPSPAPSPSPSPAVTANVAPVGQMVLATVPDGDLRLTISATHGSYAPGEPIEVAAELAYLGPHDAVKVAGSGSGLVLFGLKQLDGRFEMGYSATDDCVPYTLEQGKPTTVAYSKSGGYGADDPDAAFWTQFFADPLLRLPVGRWQITARATFLGPGCKLPTRMVDAPLVIEVR
ncbi:MAG: hypothetical protein QOH61_1602 [Chloroflexota bacterium]|jgi:hypothetical protein|nr:hypothetical protein [Chloroflexota bacterium]